MSSVSRWSDSTRRGKAPGQRKSWISGELSVTHCCVIQFTFSDVALKLARRAGRSPRMLRAEERLWGMWGITRGRAR